MPVIQAGSIAGVREGNIYWVMPFYSVTESSPAKIAEAHVTFVNGFQALADLKFANEERPISLEGALALNLSPIDIDAEPSHGLEGLVRASQYLQICTVKERDTAIGIVKQVGERITFETRQGAEVAAIKVDETAGPVDYKNIIDESPDERLHHSIDVQVGPVENGKRGRPIRPRGDDQVERGDKVHITLRNPGEQTVYETVLDVNVVGEISLVSDSSPQGIELVRGRPYTLGANRLSVLKGLTLSWPAQIPKDQPVNERLVIILTNAPINLLHLTDPSRPHTSRNRTLSPLEKLTMQISHGGSGDIKQESDIDGIFYDIAHVPFTLWPNAVSSEQAFVAAGMDRISIDDSISNVDGTSSEQQEPLLPNKLPPPELLAANLDIPSLPPSLDPAAKEIIGGIIRAARKVPPCVWVVNQHSEEITVVVSKYRPNRILTGGGIDVSFPGAGASLSSTSLPRRKHSPHRRAIARVVEWEKGNSEEGVEH